MKIDKKDFLKLKKQTFKVLLTKSDDIKKLILASLTISLCHDKCIYDDKLQVAEQFINECSRQIVLIPNINIDAVSKVSLIRNKLAHGDYAYDDIRRVIIFEYMNQYVEVSLDSIILFAYKISEYYKYLNKEYSREIIIYRNGLEILVNDHCKKRRDMGYNRRFENATHVRLALPMKDGYYVLPDNFTRKKFSLSDGYMDVDYEILGLTDKKTGMIYNPYGDSMLNNVLNLLNNMAVVSNEYIDAIEELINFYIFYIYPLDNFMKVDEQGIKTLPNDGNFDFSQLGLQDIRNDDTFSDVGKIKSYPNDLLSLYKKIYQLNERLEKLNNRKNKDEEYEKVKLSIENEIDLLLNITLCGPLKRLYEYSKNRSLIEHIRCSIMHGNYGFNEQSKIYTFFDFWKNEESYRDEVELDSFRSLFNAGNINLVMSQDREMNGRKK